MFINQNKQANHSFFMQLALQQARKSLGNTNKNPAVGCVIVKDNHVISAGYTSLNGRPHAEYNAIKLSKKNLKNSQLYVTLEPCSHYGETPPCTNVIIKKKIKKVFFAINDADTRSFDKCSSKLKMNGIQVSKGVFKNEINIFYRSYLKFQKNILPFVTCKLAISKDHYTINKNNKWITNEFSRGRVHLMRSIHDCIITSSNTINNDNPELTCRINGLNNISPSRIILDKKLKININSKIIVDAKEHHTVIFYNKINARKIKLLKKLKIKVYRISQDAEGNIDLRESLIKAKELGFSRIFVETGAKLTNSFFSKELIDDFKLFISCKNLGINGNGNIKNYFRSYLVDKEKIVEKVNLSGDKLISYKIK